MQKKIADSVVNLNISKISGLFEFFDGPSILINSVLKGIANIYFLIQKCFYDSIF